MGKKNLSSNWVYQAVNKTFKISSLFFPNNPHLHFWVPRGGNRGTSEPTPLLIINEFLKWKWFGPLKSELSERDC